MEEENVELEPLNEIGFLFELLNNVYEQYLSEENFDKKLKLFNQMMQISDRIKAFEELNVSQIKNENDNQTKLKMSENDNQTKVKINMNDNQTKLEISSNELKNRKRIAEIEAMQREAEASLRARSENLRSLAMVGSTVLDIGKTVGVEAFKTSMAATAMDFESNGYAVGRSATYKLCQDLSRVK